MYIHISLCAYNVIRKYSLFCLYRSPVSVSDHKISLELRCILGLAQRQNFTSQLAVKKSSRLLDVSTFTLCRFCHIQHCVHSNFVTGENRIDELKAHIFSLPDSCIVMSMLKQPCPIRMCLSVSERFASVLSWAPYCL